LPSKKAKTSINQHITDIIRKNNPKTVKELVELLQPEYSIPNEEILEHILRLQDQGKIAFKEHPARSPPILKNYIFSKKANWYWTIIALAVATSALVFTVPENAYPLVYIRYVFGTISVLWLPGYSFIKALFPVEVPIKTSSEALDLIERVALSLGMSLALVPITGLLLNYTPWGIRTTPVTLSLLALTTILATAALIREHQAKLKGNQ